jgi:hypothetical protein
MFPVRWELGIYIPEDVILREYRWLDLIYQIQSQKVGLFWCLTNRALRNEAVWRSGCTGPSFRDLCTSWRQVVNFTHLRLYPRRKGPTVHSIGTWIGSRACLDATEYWTFSVLQRLELRVLYVLDRSQSLYRLRYGKPSKSEFKRLKRTNYFEDLVSKHIISVGFEIFTVVTMKNVFCDIKIQFVPHRRHIMSPLQSPAG